MSGFYRMKNKKKVVEDSEQRGRFVVILCGAHGTAGRQHHYLCSSGDKHLCGKACTSELLAEHTHPDGTFDQKLRG